MKKNKTSIVLNIITFYWTCLKNPSKKIKEFIDDPNIDLKYGISKLIQANILVGSCIGVIVVIIPMLALIPLILIKLIEQEIRPLLFWVISFPILIILFISLGSIFITISVIVSLISSSFIFITSRIMGNHLEFLKFLSIILIFEGIIIIFSDFYFLISYIISLISYYFFPLLFQILSKEIIFNLIITEIIILIIYFIYHVIILKKITGISTIKSFISILIPTSLFFLLQHFLF